MMLPAAPRRARALERRDERLRRDQCRLQVRIDHRVPRRLGIVLESAGLERRVGGRRPEACVVDRIVGAPSIRTTSATTASMARRLAASAEKNEIAAPVSISALDQRAGAAARSHAATAAPAAASALAYFAAESTRASGDDGDLPVEAKQIVGRLGWRHVDKLPPSQSQSGPWKGARATADGRARRGLERPPRRSRSEQTLSGPR